ncbi:MAG: response regulator [Ruminococcus sp.]|nr:MULTISPECIES: response regulator [Ruminococcus]MCI5597773.1 response regulator [Ruminococcus sp.]MDD5890794.1 response regulator [Ruminococcus sp.]MDD6531021.1 response regulator [Ruminococcus sp.]MDD6708642.1 response regulator [Ruminococcus sp.]MDY3662771.1 response regulator [Ruminococcus bovis]
MNILALDDEELMLWALTDSLEKVFNENDIIKGFEESEDAIGFVKSLGNKPLDYAFLDIRLRGGNGIDVAKEIKKLKPKTKILFCTAYSDRAIDAFGVNAVGYLLKPITPEKIRNSLEQLSLMFSNIGDIPTEKKVEIKTFGNFDVFVDKKPIHWKRLKAKELLALLVDKKGASVTNVEIAITLWEDDNKVKSVPTIISSLRHTLKDYGVEDILIRSRNHTAIDTTKVLCDVYEFYDGKATALNLYQGEYMANYSWAEFTNAYLQSQI